MALICPTFAHNKTYDGFVDHYSHTFAIDCPQEEVELWLKLSSHFFQGTNTPAVLDHCAASNDMKGHTGQLVSLGFSAHHAGISMWVLTQWIISMAKPFCENVAAIVLQTGRTRLYVPVRNGGLGGQCAKKVVSDSPGLVDFAIGLVNSVINLADGQVTFFEKFKLQKNCEINLLIKTFLGLVEMMFGLVNVRFNLPEWQAVKVTFFALCLGL